MRAILKGTLVLLVVFGLLFAACAAIYGPGLLSDYRTRDRVLVPATAVKIETARCTSFLFVVSWCAVEYVPVRSSAAAGEIKYLVAGRHGGAALHLLQTDQQPVQVVTNFGMDHLWNRTLTLLTVLTVFAIFPFLPLLKVLSIILRKPSKGA